MSLIGSTLSAASLATNAILGDALAPYALFSIAGRVIGTIAIDVPIREVHNDTFTITQHPVESGSSTSDHYFANPQQVEMTCGFSDSTAGYEGYVQAVYASFIALAAMRTAFNVSTGKRQYTSMMIADLSVVTDPTSEYILAITVRLQQVIITSTDGGTSQGNQANPAETGSNVNGGSTTLQPASMPGLTPSGFVAGPN